MKKIFSVLLRTSVSLALLVVLFKKIDFRSTFRVISHIEPLYMVIALVVFLVINILVLYRWKMLLNAQGICLPLKRILSSFAGGVFFNLFLPSTIGGDIARTVDLSLHTKRRSVIVASVLLDRLSGFVGLVIVAIVALIFGHRLINTPSVYLIVFFLAALSGGILLVIFNNGAYRRLNRSVLKRGSFWDNFRKLHAEIYFFRSKPFVLYLNLSYSIIIQAGSALVSYFLLRSLNVKLNIIYPLIFTPIIAIITTLPIAIGGLGLRDVSSIFFYATAGVAKDTALAQSLLNFAMIVFFGLIAGIIYVSTLRYRRLQPYQAGSHSK